MRSGKLYASNDYLIDQFIQDDKYFISTEGKIYRDGKQLGRYAKEGYIEIYYKGKRLKAHRIVYRKFNGLLEADLVIEHKNGLTDDNSPDNLLLVTQKANIEYKNRKAERVNKKRSKAA